LVDNQHRPVAEVGEEVFRRPDGWTAAWTVQEPSRPSTQSTGKGSPRRPLHQPGHQRRAPGSAWLSGHVQPATDQRRSAAVRASPCM